MAQTGDPGLRRARRWPIWLLAGLAVSACLVLVAAIAARYLLPSDAALAQRTAQALERALGVPVSVGALHWQLLPEAAVVVQDFATAQASPVSIQKITFYPALGELLRRRIKLERVVLEGAVVPQLSLHAWAQQGSASSWFEAAELPLAHLSFRQVSWISRRGIPVSYDGELDFDPGWRPRQAQVWRPAVKPPAELHLNRQADADRWLVRINVGGGTADGELQLLTQAGGRLHLQGKLQPRGIEVTQALQALNRNPVIAGQASGETALSADGENVWELAQSLHSQTSFSMRSATLLRFDLGKAVRSAGRTHDGQTALDAVSGQMDTQNTAQGMVVDFSHLRAHSGALSASGKASLANRQIDAEFSVDLVDGLLGVPLRVSGPTDHVTVSVPRGAVVGAVVGTAVLPGLGTALGARVGAALGGIFTPPPNRKNNSPARP